MNEELRIIPVTNGFIIQKTANIRNQSPGDVVAVFNKIEDVCAFLVMHFKNPVPAQ